MSPDHGEGTHEVVASEPVEVRAEEDLSVTPSDPGSSEPGLLPGAAEAEPSYGEPLVTNGSDPSESSRPATDLDQVNDGRTFATSGLEPEPVFQGEAEAELSRPGVRASSSSYEYTSPPPAEPPARRAGVGSLLLGGALASALGFGAAYLARDQFAGPDGSMPAGVEERLAALEAQPAPEAVGVDALAARLTELETRVANLETAPAAGPADLDPGALREQVEQEASEIRSQVTALAERLAALEDRPAPAAPAAPLGSLASDPGPAVASSPPSGGPATGEALAAVEPRLAQIESGLSSVRADIASNREAVEAAANAVDEVRTGLGGLEARIGQVETSVGTLDTRLGEAETASAEAAEQARTAAAALTETEARSAAAEAQARTGAALAKLDAALDGGEPFEEALSDLQANGVEVPEALSAAAAAGVPSLATLREAFPEAARGALAEARAQGLLNEGGGLTGFLSNQLSLRSTAPREGTDADAVLSRAESLLAQGRLDVALTEIATLPQPVQDAMGEWIVQARARAEAETAFAALNDPEPAPVPAD